MSEQRAEYITTTQPIGSITHDLPRPVPTLRQYLQEQERDMVRKLQHIRDLLKQLPKE